MDKQKVFDTVAKHLLTQNAKSLSRGRSTCVYRSHDGKSCAVGVLIKDEFYDSSLEGRSCSNEKVVEALEASLKDKLEFGEIDLLSDLQMIHDNCTPDEWPMVLDALASTKGLKYIY